MKPHYAIMDDGGYFFDDKVPGGGQKIATIHPASAESVETILGVLPTTPVSDDTRSEFLWVRLANGDLILGVLPHGDDYFDCEIDAKFPGIPDDPVHGSAVEGESSFKFINTFRLDDKEFDVWLKSARVSGAEQQYRVRWGTAYDECATVDSSELGRHAKLAPVWEHVQRIIYEWSKS